MHKRVQRFSMIAMSADRVGPVGLNMLLALTVMWALCTTVEGQTVLKRSATTLQDALPGRGQLLFEWPQPSVLLGSHRVHGDENACIARAKKHSIEWIKKFLNPKWLPEGRTWLEDNLIMLHNEAGPIDTTRVRWEKNGYEIQVSQTLCIIAVKLTPLETKDMGNKIDQKRIFAADLCSRIVNETGLRYGLDEKNQPVMVTVTGLPDKIRKYSFQPEHTHQYANSAVAGVSPAMPMEKRPTSRDGRDIDKENRVGNLNWDDSLSSWAYWWRHVCWWCDGKSVGIFALKEEAGAHVPSYSGTLDGFFFDYLEGVPASAPTTQESTTKPES